MQREEKKMKNLKTILLTCLFLTYASAVFALPVSVKNTYPTLTHVGQDKYKVLFVKVYQINLYQSKEDPKLEALDIHYYMDLSSEKRLDRALEDMKSQRIEGGKWGLWEKQMGEIFPDVKDGDNITIVRDAAGVSSFYHNETLRGKIEDPLFSETFFNIWLGEKTELKSIRDKLLKKAYHK